MAKFQFKKRYGQNFLQNDEIIEKIVGSIHPTEKDLILEIGPGAGAITKRLKKYNAEIIAFEIDEETKRYLLQLEDEKTTIIYKDFLEADVSTELSRRKYEALYIIGNLPYYITTPIIERIIDLNLNPKEITIMVQKEVADRFLSKPKNKEYGYITVLLNYHYDIEKVIDVDRTQFYPMPKVDSTVIKLKTREKEKIDYTKFKKLLKDSFQFKRKTISNNLKNYNLKEIETILIKKGYSLSSRAEEIDLNTFIEILEVI